MHIYRGSLLKLGDALCFLFTCRSNIIDFKIFFNTFFFGVPEEAKKYHDTLKLQYIEEVASIERKSPVTSASFCKVSRNLFSYAIKVDTLEVREHFNISTPETNISVKLQIFLNNSIT